MIINGFLWIKKYWIPMLLGIAIVSGELVKFSFGLKIGLNNGYTLLDIVTVITTFYGLILIKFKFSNLPIWGKSAFLFVGVTLLSQFFSPLNLNITERLISIGYIMRFMSFLLLGIIVFQTIFARFNLYIHHMLAFSATALAFLGLLQLIFIPDLAFLTTEGWDPHFFRTVSTFLDPNFLGVFLVLCLLSVTSLIRNPLKQKLYSISFVIIYLAAVTTFSRTVALTLAVAFFSYAAILKSRKLGILAILLCAGMFIAYQIYKPAVAQPRGINKQQSAQSRINSWQTGLTVWQQNPILGVGFNSYRYALRQYRLLPQAALAGHGTTTNDSSLLFVAATTGITGLISYLLFLISIGYQSFKESKLGKHWGVVCLSGLLGLIASSFFINSLFYPWSLLWISLSASQLDKT